jgi:hypothetical protein
MDAFYAVGSELVIVAGDECLAFDPVTGSFVLDPGARARIAGTRPISDDEFDRAHCTKRAEVVERWARQLCAVAPGEPATLFAALRVPGDLVAGSGGYFDVRPPPIGADVVRVFAYHVVLRWSNGGLAAADLKRFGEGRPQPRLGMGPFHIFYRLEVAGAGSTCTIIAAFDPATTPTRTLELSLRLDKRS